jgi:hypothetical protein
MEVREYSRSSDCLSGGLAALDGNGCRGIMQEEEVRGASSGCGGLTECQCETVSVANVCVREC